MNFIKNWFFNRKQKQLQMDINILEVIHMKNGQAYGVYLYEAFGLDFGTLYRKINKMEDDGLIVSRLGDATAERGWRPKRLLTITLKGRKFYREKQNERNSI